MPNRIIKDTILTSETVGGLDDFAFRLFVSLICLADDFGRGRAHPAILKGQAFPLRPDVTPERVEQGLRDLEEADAVRLYTVEGSHYFYFPNWTKHQSVRAKSSKWPDPAVCGTLQTSASKCKQMQADESRREQMLPYSNTNTNTKSYTNTGTNTRAPTLDEVKAECREKKYATDPARFFNYYESVGWKIKGERIQNWRAMLAVWASGDKKQGINDPDHFDDLREWAEQANKRERR